MMFRLGFVLALTAAAGSMSAASPNPKDLIVPQEELSKAHELIEKLGSAVFAEREGAQDSLAKMGRFALPALIEGVNEHPSSEVRFRCQLLLPKASAADLKARLDSFLLDTKGEFEHNLPGWNEFRKVAGQGAAARAIFVDMIEDSANREIVLAAGDSSRELDNLLVARKQELYQRRFPRAPNGQARTLTLADVMTVLFAESHTSSPSAPRSISVSTLLNAPSVTAAFSDTGEKGATYKAIVLHWINTRDDAVSMNQAIAVATNLNLKEAAGAAVKLMNLKTAPPYYRGQAAMALVRLSGKEHIPDLERQLGDAQVLMSVRMAPNADPIEIQLRDVALVASLLLSGQEPEAYGFVQRYKASSGTTRYSYSNWYVPTDKRAAAFEKWKAWREKNPRPDKGNGGK